MAMLAVLLVAAALAAADQEMLAGPAPICPAVIVIHDESQLALHGATRASGHRSAAEPASCRQSGNDEGAESDVVKACCGDIATLEILAAVSILREHLPDLKIRFVNVVDLMKLQPASKHARGLSDEDYDSLFTKDKHLIFGFHGYLWLIYRLTYRRTSCNLHVRAIRKRVRSRRASI